MHVSIKKLDFKKGNALTGILDCSGSDEQSKEMSTGKPFNEFLYLILPDRAAMLSPKMQRVLRYINKSYSKRITLSKTAALIGIHPNHLCREFKKETGLSFHEYVIRTRIQRSISLLAYTEKSMKSISYEVGFSGPETFCKTFKRFVRMSPRKYRNSYRYG